MILEYLKEKKPSIDKEILSTLIKKSKEVDSINNFGREGLEKLAKFAVLGKSIRGILVLLGAELYGFSSKDTELIKLAAAIEIIHSSILIQDDIQDDDILRRGNPTVFYQYQQYAHENNFKNPKFYGQSIAMDVFLQGHYTAIEYITKLDIDSDLKVNILSFISSEIVKVGIAQSQDIYHGYVHADRVNIRDIENVGLYKTGRYTISMPLMLGGLYMGKQLNEMKDIEKIGERLGVIFQIKDDELGLFSTTEDLGKPVGSDISENKKTHYRELLYQRVNVSEKKLLSTSFGNKNISKKKLTAIKDLIEKYNIRTEVQDHMNSIARDVKNRIHKSDITESGKQMFLSFTEYLLSRTK